MEGSELICCTDRYTFRVLKDGPAEIDETDVYAVNEAIDKTMEDLDLPGNLFVTGLRADGILCERGDGFAAYWQGTQSILIALAKPDEVPDDHDWTEELRSTVRHELVHYKQDLEGRLTGSRGNEREAERYACPASWPTKAIAFLHVAGWIFVGWIFLWILLDILRSVWNG